MKKPYNWTFILLIWLSSIVPIAATTCTTPQGQVASAIASYCYYYKKENGRLPQTWEEIAKVMNYGEMGKLNRSMDEVYYWALPMQRYTFIFDRVTIKLPYEEGRIVLMMRSSFRDTDFFGGMLLDLGLRERGRYVIYEMPGGVIRYRYISEREVVAAFNAAGVSLPVSDKLGMYPHEKKYWQWFIAKWVILILMGIAGFAFYWLRKQKRKFRFIGDIKDYYSR